MSKTIKAPKTVKSQKALVRFAITSRPQAGELLASYTAAWLTLTGMGDDAAVPTKLVRQLAGETALAYHKRNGNFEMTDAGIKLTARGFLHFMNAGGEAGKARAITPNPEFVKGYSEVMLTGKTNELVKNAANIVPIKG